MASKFVGVLNAVSQQMTVERPSVSGPHTFTIANGAYYPADRGVNIAELNDTGTTMDVTETQTFSAGDVATVWRPSTDAAVFSDTIASVTSSTIVWTSSHTWQAGDLIYISDDLIGYITTRVRSQDFSALSTFYLTMSKGVASMSVGGGITITVSWPTADVQRWLRYSGTVTITGSSESPDPTRQVEGVLYMDKDVQRDVLRAQPRASQSQTVSGRRETLYRSRLNSRTFQLRLTGPPRSSLWTVQQAAKDMHDTHWSRGLRFRYHVDADVETPYADTTNPFGYEVFVSDLDTYSATPISRGNDNHTQYSFPALEYVA
jgi:hypothetical protein